MNKKPITLSPDGHPDAIRPYLTAGNLYDSSCGAEAQTLYCDAGAYIKIAPTGTLAREASLARQFYALGLGVEVLCCLSADRDYLVTRSAPGQDLTHALEDPEQLCRMYASALHALHSIRPEDFPAAPSLVLGQEAAHSPFREGTLEDYLITESIPIRTRQEAWEIIRASGHRWTADSLIHGDACLPNLIFREGQFSAFIDLGQSGAGNRHTDLFWAIWSLQFNLKTERYTDLFLELYGRDQFDPELLKLAAAFEIYG